MNYDAWLEKPFQDHQAKIDECIDLYRQSAKYKADFASWAAGDPDATEEMFEGSARFEYLLELFADDLFECELLDDTDKL